MGLKPWITGPMPSMQHARHGRVPVRESSATTSRFRSGIGKALWVPPPKGGDQVRWTISSGSYRPETPVMTRSPSCQASLAVSPCTTAWCRSLRANLLTALRTPRRSCPVTRSVGFLGVGWVPHVGGGKDVIIEPASGPEALAHHPPTYNRR